jgi:hypothetical protein
MSVIVIICQGINILFLQIVRILKYCYGYSDVNIPLNRIPLGLYRFIIIFNDNEKLWLFLTYVIRLNDPC